MECSYISVLYYWPLYETDLVAQLNIDPAQVSILWPKSRPFKECIVSQQWTISMYLLSIPHLMLSVAISPESHKNCQ